MNNNKTNKSTDKSLTDISASLWVQYLSSYPAHERPSLTTLWKYRWSSCHPSFAPLGRTGSIHTSAPKGKWLDSSEGFEGVDRDLEKEEAVVTEEGR